MGVRTYEVRREPLRRRRYQSAATAVPVGLLVLVGLLANGRPIGGGEDLPLIATAVAAPILALARLGFALDATGTALAGKLTASLFAAVAAAGVYLAAGSRRPSHEAWVAALLFAFGTPVWAAAQSLGPAPLAVAFVAWAVVWLVRAEDDPASAPRAALPLWLAAAVNPVDAGLAIVLVVAGIVRTPRDAARFALWSLPGLALFFGEWVFGGGRAFLGRPADGWGEAATALFASPATGLFVFAPVVLVALFGLARVGRRGGTDFAIPFLLAFLVHGLGIAAWPLAGESWGPRAWADAMPLVLVFVGDGLDRLKLVGAAVAASSVAIQALGAFSYDTRWDRLYAATGEERTAALWRVDTSPIPFQIGERLLILARPERHGGAVRMRERRMVFSAPEGSRLSVSASRLMVGGADPTFTDAHLLGGARPDAERVRLLHPGDGCFLRVRPGSFIRHLEVRIAGRGQGTLALGEAAFSGPEPRVREKTVAGEFRLRLPYHEPDSGGADVTISLRSGGVDISAIDLVPPNEPEKVFRLNGQRE